MWGGGGVPRKNLLCDGGIDFFWNKVYTCNSVGIVKKINVFIVGGAESTRT